MSSVLDVFVKGCYFILLSEFCEQSLLILSFCFEFGTIFFTPRSPFTSLFNGFTVSAPYHARMHA